MRILLASVGAVGDILPFVGWGKVLRARGHEVFFLSTTGSQGLAERCDLRFVDLDINEESLPPRAPSSIRLLRRFMVECPQLIPRVYEAIATCQSPGDTVVAAQGWLFGARIAQERLGVPLATVHLQPLMFGNREEPGVLPALLGGWGRRLRERLVQATLNRLFGRPLNDFRQTLGLPPVDDIRSWFCSPQLVLGMFPSWFSPPGADWPAQTLLAGFPRFDTLEEPSNLHEVEDFLADGNPPLVFSHFSLLEPKPDYLTTAVEVARQLGRRAVLLSVRTERPPVALPDGVRHFGYVPLSRLLPRAAALVHHGGIGTLSLALAAGIPQVAVPRFLDQPDNSRRLARLGAAAVIRPRQYRAGALAAKLKGLLDSAEVRDRCRHYAELSRRDDCYGTASAALEGLLGRTPSCPLPLAMPAETAAATAICGEAACG